MDQPEMQSPEERENLYTNFESQADILRNIIKGIDETLQQANDALKRSRQFHREHNLPYPRDTSKGYRKRKKD